MGPTAGSKVPDLRRPAARVASRSTVRWSWLPTFLGFCLLAAVVGGPTVGLPHAQIATAFAGIPRPAVGRPVSRRRSPLTSRRTPQSASQSH
jgi:hypothetical protein